MKQAARAEAFQRLQTLSSDDRVAASGFICRRLLEMPELRQARTALLFRPLRDEPDILPLVRELRAAGIRIGFPVYPLPDELIHHESPMPRMYFRELPPMLDPGSLRGSNARSLPDVRLEPDTNTVLLAPGRGFTTAGVRLGRGGGYYDEYLAYWRERTQFLTAGVCFARQIFDSLPATETDQSLDMVCTELDLIQAP
ncbi:5-formyltetrahydrofolate cyclo-ligase [Spirochaeta africana]|uniref:5-formyltetrahydrofolate cyclo-ligase n=1 Tax=Spirochaeta africana (strain ATCC 700263 / DSM 8902 / Z-7692) TaxID=889378 RepID=H9UFW7_SPIAZ|nr:5-formyltetrahydrofolate cyclo-ligase [Spirochaeta africana]AFG36410.1 5,10-methenyltetrahydrofolate synthetase [Spirochaeta africana DSM 8902]